MTTGGGWVAGTGWPGSGRESRDGFRLARLGWLA